MLSPFEVVPQPTLFDHDARGHVITNSTASVSVYVSSGTATLSGTTTVNAVHGVATFTNLVLTGAPQAVDLTFVTPGAAPFTATITLTN